MRTIMYAVFNKDTNEKVFVNCRLHKCKEYILNNEGNFEIRHKWMSI